MQRFYTTLIAMVMALGMASAQGWPQNYGGVMLQGFYWNSFDDTNWTVLEKQADRLSGTFDLVWIPQSGRAKYSPSNGYDPLYWFADYNSSFGTGDQLKQMIKTFKEKNIGTIADVVINHRETATGWTDFVAEEYNGQTYALTANDICSDDEAAKNGYQVGPNKDTGEGWTGMRDLDHQSENVQTAVKAYLKMLLNDFGYTGFRYDMVKGYAGEYTQMYNNDSKPKFSVGECWDGTPTIRRWIDATGKTSAAFDFQFRYTVRNAANSGNWTRLGQQNDGNYPLVSREYESGNYSRYAVTFVENHDTEKRSDNEQDPLRKDTLAANAYLLAMPGTPCVFLKHWQAYEDEIRAMIAARKLAGITNTSTYSPFRSNAAYYANTVKVGDESRLLVVVGDEKQVAPSTGQWTKILSGYHYAYYLANTLETAWADKGPGEFSSELTVGLTAVSATAGAKLVYTTDGSTPTASNGTQVESGSSIKLSQTTTLKVGLLIGSAVSGIITRTYIYKEPEEEPPFEIPSFCTVADGEVCAFFEAPVTWTATVSCWAWSNTPSDNFTNPEKKQNGWPGVACQELGTAANGKRVWKWTWDGTRQNNSAATRPQFIIFSNSGTPQTADLAFVNGGYYGSDGLLGSVTAGIGSVRLDQRVPAKVYTLDGRLVSTDGTTDRLPKGIYVVKGRKYVRQ